MVGGDADNCLILSIGSKGMAQIVLESRSIQMYCSTRYVLRIVVLPSWPEGNSTARALPDVFVDCRTVDHSEDRNVDW
jgi:hypothetical protein